MYLSLQVLYQLFLQTTKLMTKLLCTLDNQLIILSILFKHREISWLS